MVGESKKAFAAFRDYAHLGPARSLRKLHARYVEQAAAVAMGKEGAQIPPTVRLSTIFGWSAKNDWPARVEAWDKERDAEAERAVKAARLRLALAAEEAAAVTISVMRGFDDSQRRLAAGDVLDRVGISKGVTVELEPGDDTDDWVERVGGLLGKVLAAGSGPATAGESESG